MKMLTVRKIRKDTVLKPSDQWVRIRFITEGQET